MAEQPSEIVGFPQCNANGAALERALFESSDDNVEAGIICAGGPRFKPPVAQASVAREPSDLDQGPSDLRRRQARRRAAALQPRAEAAGIDDLDLGERQIFFPLPSARAQGAEIRRSRMRVMMAP